MQISALGNADDQRRRSRLGQRRHGRNERLLGVLRRGTGNPLPGRRRGRGLRRRRAARRADRDHLRRRRRSTAAAAGTRRPEAVVARDPRAHRRPAGPAISPLPAPNYGGGAGGGGGGGYGYSHVNGSRPAATYACPTTLSPAPICSSDHSACVCVDDSNCSSGKCVELGPVHRHVHAAPARPTRRAASS